MCGPTSRDARKSANTLTRLGWPHRLCRRWIASAALCEALLTSAPHSLPTFSRFRRLEIRPQEGLKDGLSSISISVSLAPHCTGSSPGESSAKHCLPADRTMPTISNGPCEGMRTFMNIPLYAPYGLDRQAARWIAPTGTL